MFTRFTGLIIFILLSPLFLIIAILVYCEDGYPFLFTQKRVGKNKTYFYIYKFRSMKKNTPNVASHLLENPEKYLLKIGSLLRKTSLDEIPNLINIIKGQMVFVGPRPALYNQQDLIKLREIAGINALKPGLTGWAQINGRDQISLEKKVELEKIYLTNRSLFLDIKILALTVSSVLSSKGVKH